MKLSIVGKDNKSSFFRLLGTHFEQITSVHFQAISDTDNQNLEFFP